MKIYIEYLDSKNNFRQTKKYFDTYEDAIKFMQDTFDKVDSDFIKYED